MSAVTIAKIIRETGLGIGAFALCAWMVIYIVRRMGNSLDKLISNLDKFCENVKKEHSNNEKQHEALMQHHEKFLDSNRELSSQHKEMIECLGRINGYKDNH